MKWIVYRSAPVTQVGSSRVLSRTEGVWEDGGSHSCSTWKRHTERTSREVFRQKNMSSVRQMMLWSSQHLDRRHERSRNSQEDFVVWVLLRTKWLSLLRLIQSAMRFDGGQVFQKTNDSALSLPRMVYWTSLRWCDSYVSYSPCIILFSRRLCVTW